MWLCVPHLPPSHACSLASCSALAPGQHHETHHCSILEHWDLIFRAGSNANICKPKQEWLQIKIRKFQRAEPACSILITQKAVETNTFFPPVKKKQLTVQKIRYPWYNLHFVEALWACFCSQAILLHQVPTTRKHAVLKLVGVKTHKCSCHQFYSFLQYSK